MIASSNPSSVAIYSPKVTESSDNGITSCVVIDSEHHAFRGTVVTLLIRGGALSRGFFPVVNNFNYKIYIL